MSQIDAVGPHAVPQLAIFTDFDGTLVELAETPDDIDVPWNFAIDETGTWLYAPNQMGSTIVQFEIDPETGALTPTGNITETPMPFAMILVNP